MISTKPSEDFPCSALVGWLLLVAIEVAAAWGILTTRPPTIDRTANDDPTAFSNDRAWAFLEKIAREPHPVGTAEHTRVQVEILTALTSLELDPSLSSPRKIQGSTPQGDVPLVNIVCRVSGTDSTGAVLVAAHYDTAPTSPGAGDDGVAVAALLETLRAVLNDGRSTLRNDLILLITDGEEQGLRGAAGFVAEHPWSQDVKLALNFEARGNSGPSILFETNPENGRVIREFARAVDSPISSSLAYTVYQMLPNDTDFTIFKRAGYAGLNFAFIDGVDAYHSPKDTLENVSRRSLEHHGRQARALTRHFGGLDLSDLREPDRVFFQLPGGPLVHYPMQFAIWISALIVALLLTTLWIGVRRGVLTFRGITEGCLGFLTWTRTALLAGVVLWGIWYLLSTADVFARLEPRGENLRSPLLALAFWNTLLAVSPLASPWRRETQRSPAALQPVEEVDSASKRPIHPSSSSLKLANATAGILCVWALILVFMTVEIPATTYLVAWPLLLSTVSLAAFVSRDVESWGSIRLGVLLLVTGAPIASLFAVHVYLFLLAGAASATFAVAAGILTSLVGVTLLLAQLRVVTSIGRRTMILTTGSLAIASFVGAYLA